MSLSPTRLLVAVLLLATTVVAQLSGTYTIDSSLPAMPGNYTSFTAAAADLQSQGISGYTEFIVFPGTGPYAGFSLGQVTGTTALNEVRFTAFPGTRPVITGVASGYTQTVRLGTGSVSTTAAGTGPSYVTLDGFEVTGAPSGAAILAVGCNFVTIRNCIAHTSGSGIGLTISHDSVIEDCEVYGTNHTPGTGGSTSYSGGIFAYYLSARNRITRNRVHDCIDNGMFIGSSGSSTATPDNIVTNNMIWNCGTQTSTTYTGGIACRRATNSVIANNTVSMPANSNYACISLMGGSSSSPLLPREVTNNIMQHLGTGACFRTEYAGQTGGTQQDYNLFDPAGGGAVAVISTSVSGTNHATLAAWQGASGAEANSVVGSPAFVSAIDLHITPASLAFNAGVTLPEVIVDIDLTTRPMGGTPDIGADEAPASGLFASFTTNVTSGPAALSVTFTDASFSSSGSGVTGWAWDVDNDGTVDYTTQNVNHVYTCPGTYSVSLTVTDTSNPASTVTRTNLITVTDYIFDVSTSGAGDLTVNPIPAACYPNATRGFTLISFDTSGPVGGGAFFGVYPDSLTFFGIFSPAAVGNVLHFIPNGVTYPDAPLIYPVGTVSPWAGVTMDWAQVLLDNNWQVIHVSNVDRITL